MAISMVETRLLSNKQMRPSYFRKAALLSVVLETISFYALVFEYLNLPVFLSVFIRVNQWLKFFRFNLGPCILPAHHPQALLWYALRFRPRPERSLRH